MYWHRLKSSVYARRVALLAGSTLLAQVINFASSFILTRLYGPADYGALSLYISFITIAGLMATLGMEYAIVGAKGERAIRYLVLSLLLCVVNSVVAALVFALFSGFNFFSYGLIDIRYAPLVCLSVFAVGSFSAFRYWGIHKEYFSRIGKVTVVRNIMRAAVQILFPLLAKGPAGLILGETLGRTAGNYRLIKDDIGSIRSTVRETPFRYYSRLFRASLNYPLYLMPSQLINTVAIVLPAVLFVRCFGAEAGGHFSFVLTIMAVPISLVTGSLADVFHQKLSVSTDRKKVFVKNLSVLAAISVPVFLVACLGSPFLFPLLFGAKWALSGQIAAITSVLMLAQLIIVPLSRAVYVFKKEKSKLVYDISALITVVLPFGIKELTDISFLEAVWLFTLLRTLSYVVYLAVLFRIVNTAVPGMKHMEEAKTLVVPEATKKTEKAGVS